MRRTRVLLVVAALCALRAAPSDASRSISGPAATSHSTPARAADPGTRTTPRTVLALYDGAHVEGPRSTTIHRLAEMPLNHLGLRVRYHDIRGGLPSHGDLGDIRGVLTWFATDSMPNPQAYLQWVDALRASGKPLVVIGAFGALNDVRGNPVPLDAVNRVTSGLGWRYEGGWIATTYGAKYDVADDRVVGFERRLPVLVPPYGPVRAARRSDVALRVSIAGQRSSGSDLVVLGKHGSFVSPGYAYFSDLSGEREFRQWLINPFEFFRRAFDTDPLPKPDTTTISGRRIYYSHVDGDGWRNLTQIEPFRSRYVNSARMVLDRIIRPWADFPVTVGAIAGDLDPAWHGTEASLAVAREIYALPHVEAAIHTYSHPLHWAHFDSSAAKARGNRPKPELTGSDVIVVDGYVKPRMYEVEPFSLAKEIDGAASFVNALLPKGKRVEMVQWPGDTKPFEAILARTRQRGLANINGGDTRFDREFPSATWVAPLGVRVGNELQVFASNSNENTYTDLWRDRFFGFAFLVRTVRNTGTPRRLKPFNLYYHMYSGERLSSLNAALANLQYARTLSLAPVEASRFSRIAEGFFATELEPSGAASWRVRKRGALQTLRFDAATLLGVDFARSQGVIGQRHELGSLYVALDEAVTEPLVSIKTIRASAGEPEESEPYLIESRWRVMEVVRSARIVRFRAEGFGPGEFVWHWPSTREARVRWTTASGTSGELRATKAAAGTLAFELPRLNGQRVAVTVEAVEGIGGS